MSPCPGSTKASSALLQAARQQLPLQRQSALSASKGSVTQRVSSWEQLVKAVDNYKGPPPTSNSWAVFELPAGTTAITASSTLRLKPGMAVVVARGAKGQQRVRISCKQGVESAFDVGLIDAETNK